MSGTDIPPLGKQLASNDKKVRDKAVKSLKSFLAGKRAEVPVEADGDWAAETEMEARYSELELLKLWKALYYCMYMSDKPLVQQQLATTLADLLLLIRPQETNSSIARFRTALAFLRAFWTTVLRQWPSIDRHRMDKYYMFLRRYVTASLRMLAREDWNSTAIAEYSALISSENGPLCPTNAKIPISIPVHYSQVFFSSLQECISTSESDAPLPLIALLQPFIQCLAQAPQKAVCETIIENIFDPLHYAASQHATSSAPAMKRRKVDPDSQTPEASILDEAKLCTSDGQTLALEDLDSAIFKALFAEASKPETRESNRRRMYKYCRDNQPEEVDEAE